MVVENGELVTCSLLTSQTLTDNFFCSGFGRCIHGNVFLPSVEGEHTEGYECYASAVCYDGETVVNENELLPNPNCPSLDAVCTMAGLVPSGATVKHRRTCDPPFKQYSFGCMYFNTTRRNLRSSVQFCKNLGSSLASFDTHEDFEAMRAHLINHDSIGHFWVYAHKVDETWVWAKNGRPVEMSANTSEWLDGYPSQGFGKQCTFADSRRFQLRDVTGTYPLGVACHVWYL
ncbi:C-type lectin-like [Trinorchestia longiramus]|nr:C-type lectin-like [Trinorchestia longiramus]